MLKEIFGKILGEGSDGTANPGVKKVVPKDQAEKMRQSCSELAREEENLAKLHEEHVSKKARLTKDLGSGLFEEVGIRINTTGETAPSSMDVDQGKAKEELQELLHPGGKTSQGADQPGKWLGLIDEPTGKAAGTASASGGKAKTEPENVE